MVSFEVNYFRIQKVRKYLGLHLVVCPLVPLYHSFTQYIFSDISCSKIFLFSDEMTRMMFDDDSTVQDFSKPSCAAWEKSLCRKVAGCIVSLLDRAYQLEVLDDDSAPSLLSKKAFYDKLSKTMTDYRGLASDRTERIVWITYPTRRLGNQFKSSTWCAEAAVLQIESVSITRLVSPDQRGRTRNRPIDNPETILESCTNDFGAEISYDQISPLRIIAIRILMFHKEHLLSEGKIDPEDNVPPLMAANWVDGYSIIPGVNLRMFFWSDKSWKTFMKYSLYRSGRYVSPKISSEDVKTHRNMWMKARANVASWDRTNWDPSSLFSHVESNQYDKDLVERMDCLVKRECHYGEINKIAVKHGIITEPYLWHLWKQYQIYKAKAVSELNSEGTVGERARKKFRYKP